MITSTCLVGRTATAKNYHSSPDFVLIEFITASAGSGKTHRLTKIVCDALADGSCPPDGLIATTFTRGAANELQERLRESLYERDQPEVAARLGAGMIGTVHSVCRMILERFAFEAGIAPDVRILDESDASILLNQAIAQGLPLEDQLALNELGDVLSERDDRTGKYAWRGLVGDIIKNARSNRIPRERLADLGRQNADHQLACWPEPGDARGMDLRLRRALNEARDQFESTSLNGSSRKYLGLIRRALRAIDRNPSAPPIPWALWDSLAEDGTDAAHRDWSRTQALKKTAAAYPTHPRLRDDVRRYLELVFRVAADALPRYQTLKDERGVHDFNDLEVRCLDLIQTNAEVREILGDELKLLVVDEFQDTSPIQLALFRELSTLATKSHWVGDVKQAIYGFRGTDPELTRVLLRDKAHVTPCADPLTDSWRSAPQLVNFANELFTKPFMERMDLQPREIQLTAIRGVDVDIDPELADDPDVMADAMPPAVELVGLSSGVLDSKNRPKRLSNSQKSETEAALVARIIRSAEPVIDKPSVRARGDFGTERSMRRSDIGVLVRTNRQAAELANQLAAHGIESSLSKAGLLATPEAVLAIAAVRRLSGNSDSLAAAELIALGNPERSPEDWLQDRLEYLREQSEIPEAKEGEKHPHADPSGRNWTGGSVHVAALDAASTEAVATLTPLAFFDCAIDLAEVLATITSWGPTTRRSAQRRNNVERLRGYVQDYQERSTRNAVPATITGLLVDLDLRVDDETDWVGVDHEIDAVQIGTYHRAKGLEWPVVVLSSLDQQRWTRLFDLSADFDKIDQAPDFAAPLDNRTLRCWINPLGRFRRDRQVVLDLLESDHGKRMERLTDTEDLRLLYVAMTRARDRLYLAHESALPLDEALALITRTCGIGQFDHASCLQSYDVSKVIKPSSVSEPEPDSQVPWFSAPAETEMPASPPESSLIPARITPSKAEPIAGAKGTVHEITAVRLPLNELGDKTDDSYTDRMRIRDLGDAFHRAVATDILNRDRDRPTREAVTRALLKHWELDENVVAADVVDAIDRYRTWVSTTFGELDQELVEVPFDIRRPNGQRIRGYIDHVIFPSSGGAVILDHKAFPGGNNEAMEVALSYSGQLAAYCEALATTNSAPADQIRTIIHFPVLGTAIEVESAANSDGD